MEKEVPPGVHSADGRELHWREEFFKNPEAKDYEYYDEDHKYIGNLNGEFHGKYLFILPPRATIVYPEDKIFYIKPPIAVGGRRKRRTNRRKNKNRRTKSRRNRRS